MTTEAVVMEVREHDMAAQPWDAALLGLAGQLEALPADAPLQARLELSQQALGFLAVGVAAAPRWLAACCRASAALNEPCLAVPPPLDQQVVAVRRLRLEALADQRGQRRPLRVSAPAPVVPADDDDDGPEAAPGAAEPHPPIGGTQSPKKALRPRHLRMRSRPADPEAAERWRQRQERIAEQSGRRGPMATAPARGAEPAAEPAPPKRAAAPRKRTPAADQPQPPEGWLKPAVLADRWGCSEIFVTKCAANGRIPVEQTWRRGRYVWIDPATEKPAMQRSATPQQRRYNPLPPVPAGWTRAVEAAEILSVRLGTLTSWRKRGQLGPEGEGWCWRGRRETLIADHVIERIEAEAGERIDSLLAQLPPCAAADPR